MSTLFKPEWLQPGAVIPVDIPTLAAFAEELRRVNQENQALRQALSQPEQEPVAWISEGGDVSRSKRHLDEMGFKCNPLYTAPAKHDYVIDCPRCGHCCQSEVSKDSERMIQERMQEEIDELRQALEKEQEPGAWISERGDVFLLVNGIWMKWDLSCES